MSTCFGAKRLVRLQSAWGCIGFVLLSLTLTISCRHGVVVEYRNGIKSTDTYVDYPRRSTSYTRRGKIVYTDSITGHRVKVEKYRSKISCWGGGRKRHVVITYDSAGKRTSRENKLRRKNCDSCQYYRIRTKW